MRVHDMKKLVTLLMFPLRCKSPNTYRSQTPGGQTSHIDMSVERLRQRVVETNATCWLNLKSHL